MRFSVRIQGQRCKSCELCLPACPKKIMTITSVKNETGFYIAGCSDAAACSGCAACAQVCPETAIEIYREDD